MIQYSHPNGKCVLKFLFLTTKPLPTDFLMVEKNSQTTIQLSAEDEVVPNTDARIMQISGLLNPVLNAMKRVLPVVVHSREENNAEHKVILLVTNPGAGAIIGRNGIVINDIMKRSNNVLIKVAQPSEMIVQCQERTITVTAARKEYIEMAVYWMLCKLAECPATQQSTVLDYKCLASPPAGHPGLKLPHHVSMPLHDTLIAGVIGRGGSSIKEIHAKSGAIIKVNQKEKVNTEGERVVTIEGTAEQVAMASRLIGDRCAEVEQEHGGGGGSDTQPPVPYYAAAPDYNLYAFNTRGYHFI
tara:strand:- start:5033 stop:5932 length:900 start_codon:yes stop_codon:yes gene_type:complete